MCVKTPAGPTNGVNAACQEQTTPACRQPSRRVVHLAHSNQSEYPVSTGGTSNPKPVNACPSLSPNSETPHFSTQRLTERFPCFTTEASHSTKPKPRLLRQMDLESSNKDARATSLQRTPVRQSMLVPLEILIKIFLLSLPPIHLAQARQRTTLALVCRLWNDIIEKTPILWSQISLSDRTSNAERSLSKSAKYPIDVYGNCPHVRASLSSNSCCRCYRFFREITGHTERWRRVELAVDNDERLVAQASTHFPFLESVKLRSNGREAPAGGYLSLVAGARAPRLRELLLDRIDLSQWDVSLPPTLSSLVIQNMRISSRQIISVLAASPNLTVLCLSSLFLVREDGAHDSALVELASLQEVTFTGTSSDLIREVMEKIQFPPVCKVLLKCSIDDPDVRASFLDPTLSRYLETARRVGRNTRVRIVVYPPAGFEVLLQCLNWSINLKMSSRYGVRDTLEWFGIPTKRAAALLGI